MKLTKFFFAAIGLLFLVSCGSQPTQTIENLKAAATGETNASAHYAAFSEKALAEGHLRVANMFAATSYAESLHAAKHLEELAKLGVTDYKPEVAPFENKTTLENLTAANDGEVYEFTTMYPGFMKIATEEKANGALISFDWANRAEQKHSGFYKAAIEALCNPEVGDSGIAEKWVVCNKCGDTYRASEVGSACELCGTPVGMFKEFIAAQ